MLELNKLTTEARNPGTAGLDTMTPLEIATVMNREDEQVVDVMCDIENRNIETEIIIDNQSEIGRASCRERV